MALQYIFQMQGLTKAYPGGKKVFENIWLSFYPDAKIGVVGVNGSGKSTLLKIMAGHRQGVHRRGQGRRRRQDAATWSRSRTSTSSSTSGATSSPGARRRRSSTATTPSPPKLGEDYTDELMEEMNALQEKIDAGDLWDIDSRIEMAMDALRCPPDDWPVDKLSGGEKRRDRPGAPAAVQARHAAAGRADQPPGRRERGLAAAPPGGLPGLRDPGHPRPLLPGPGDQVDAGARSRQGRALRGQLLRLAGAEDQAGRAGAVARARPASAP